MFKVIDSCGYIHNAYGAFIDGDGDIQFILCDNDGVFYKTNSGIKEYYKLYEEPKNIEIPNVLLAEGCDEELFINGKSVCVHDRLYPSDVLNALAEYGVIKFKSEER